jgi:radical SAM protein with 4Fe4S-binding SPASM domain
MTGCPTYELDDAAFRRTFSAEVRNRRVPLNGSMDLTYRCNLRCVHCYAGPRTAADSREMTTEMAKSILDQVAGAGCLFMLLSGGEPMLRRDFAEIYVHARRLGMLVTVFTNATLVADRMVAMFEEWPPLKVEASIYGATDATHDGVTGVPGSLSLTLAGVDRLVARGVRVGLKTMLMKVNISEFEAMENLAKTRGVPFRSDAVLFPRLDGDASPIEQLVPPGEAVRIEMADGKRVAEWRKYMDRVAGYAPSDRRYDCGAGISTFHVDPAGNLFPCMMARNVSYSLRDGTFEDGWKNVVPKVREEPARAGSPCGRCERRASCAYCPGMLGDAGADSLRRHVCEAAALRGASVDEGLKTRGEVAA